MPEAEIRLGKACLFILDLFAGKRSDKTGHRSHEGTFASEAMPHLDGAEPRPHTIYVVAARYGKFRPVCSGLPNP